MLVNRVTTMHVPLMMEDDISYIQIGMRSTNGGAKGVLSVEKKQSPT